MADARTSEHPAATPSRISIAKTASLPVAIVFLVFLASLLVIPIGSNAGSGDDWVYVRSVEMLVRDGRLHILDLSVTTAVFQVFWGALFSIYHVSFVTTRVSTIVIVLLSGLAMYALCREMKISPQRSALGTAVYLFNPLTFGLAFTFMTDPHFTALLVITVWLSVRGLTREPEQSRVIVLASVAASCAFLVRQQGILIPLSVGLYLVLAGRWRLNAAGLRMTGYVAGIPALTMVGYYIWLYRFNGVPEQQDAFLGQMVDAGFHDSRILISRMVYISLAYIGAFVLPIALGAVIHLRNLRPARSTGGIAITTGWLAVLVAGAIVFFGQGRLMPYIPQYAGPKGIGPTDLHGGRPWLVGDTFRTVFTWLCLAASAFFIVAVTRATSIRCRRERSGASLLAMIGVWQFIGALPPSYHFRNWIISVDRYLLPLVPIVIVLLLWALRGHRVFMPLAWIAIALVALFSIAGTRDFLVFQETTWDLARDAVSSGIPLTKIDAGANWDGYYLYDYSIEHHITQQTPGGPWWTNLFAPATDSTFIVSSQPRKGYQVIATRPYSSWLGRDQHTMYLLQKIETPANHQR